MTTKITVALAATLAVTTVARAQTARPTLADASPYVTKMNGGKPVDCTASKVKINFGSGRGEGYCQAVLADLTKSWENGVDIPKLDVLIPADKMPAAPPASYELKGDKLGSPAWLNIFNGIRMTALNDSLRLLRFTTARSRETNCSIPTTST